jgi:hypothetical protein
MSFVGLSPVSRYDERIENSLDVCLRTPGLSNEDAAKALLARADARRIAGERLLARAQQGMTSRYVTVNLNT